MEAWLEMLNQHEHLIDALFGAVSLLTVFVVILLNYRANMMAERAIHESRLMREMENRPYVFFHILLENGNTVVNFSLTNQGKGIARKIQFTIDQKLTITRNREKTSAKNMAIFKPLSFLAPGGEFKEYADMPRVFFKENEDIEELTGRIEYEDAGGKKFVTAVQINLKAIANRRFIIRPGFDKLVKKVEEFGSMIQRKMR